MVPHSGVFYFNHRFFLVGMEFKRLKTEKDRTLSSWWLRHFGQTVPVWSCLVCSARGQSVTATHTSHHFSFVVRQRSKPCLGFALRSESNIVRLENMQVIFFYCLLHPRRCFSFWDCFANSDSGLCKGELVGQGNWPEKVFDQMVLITVHSTTRNALKRGRCGSIFSVMEGLMQTALFRELASSARTWEWRSRNGRCVSLKSLTKMEGSVRLSTIDSHLCLESDASDRLTFYTHFLFPCKIWKRRRSALFYSFFRKYRTVIKWLLRRSSALYF